MRELCELAAKSGDLDDRFTPSPSADEGVAGHRLVASRRPRTQRSELPLQARIGELLVRGRADGFDSERGIVEEVKTLRGDPAGIAANRRALHWAQAKVYAAMLCEQTGLRALTVRLTYLDIDSGRETSLDEHCEAPVLEAFFAALCERFAAWARRQLAHRTARDAALAALAFPYGQLRGGQRTLAENVYRAARLGRCLLAQAGTGSGKTAGTLFPLLKAMPTLGLDKLFFVTAKGSGHEPPLALLARIRREAAPLRVLQLVARDKACEHPENRCNASCPLAAGFYDRLPAAREAAAQAGDLSRPALRELALAHRVCPYHLAQEMVRWADVVVADYSHFFDSSALLHALTRLNEWRVALLVDEAHNLIDRARDMYTASLERDELRLACAAAPAALQPVLRRLQRAWTVVAKGAVDAYSAQRELPRRFVAAVQQAADAIADASVAGSPQAIEPRLTELQFALRRFVRLAETFGSHSLFDVQKRGHSAAGSVLTIRNAVPAPFLAPRFAAAHAAVLFSATLAPPQFQIDMLGLPASTAWLDVAAPFNAAQLDVRIAAGVDTRFERRAASAPALAALIVDELRRRPGNYMAFVSSFDYLQLLERALREADPALPVWPQTRAMTEAQREAFLSRFVIGGQGIGLAVLGGVFAEGVDLPGERLIGAFIATLGLPQWNAVNEELRARLDEAFDGKGFDYAYLVPGLRKVVQAAGRVVRTPQDRGTVVLIDRRFTRPEVVAMLPAWWRPRRHPGLSHPDAPPP